MAGVNAFDAGVVAFFNHFARRSYALDGLVRLVNGYMFRVTGILAVLWWAWFRDREDKSTTREVLASGMLACLFSLALSRGLSAVMPFRERPLREPTLHFQLPYGENARALIGWSSFPSDHAAVYFTLAACLWFVSRPAGAVAVGWALLVTALPRVYLGLHYPTDIISGMLLGVGVACLASTGRVRRVLSGVPMRWEDRHPGAFYAGMFLYTFQLATAFDPLRDLLQYAWAVGAQAARLLHR